MLPDAVFDQKLISKELLVRQPEISEEYLSWDSYFKNENQIDKDKKQKRQSTYLLIDVSGTTASHNRLLLEKAIAMQFILSNQREKGTIYLRFFNHDVSRLIISNNGEKTKHFWSELLRPFVPFGGTNMQRGIETALRDISFHAIDPDSEILVISDGLTRVNHEQIIESANNTKINFVLIGEDRPDLTEIELREICETRLKKWKNEWEDKLEKNEFENHLKKMENKFWAGRYDEQQRYYNQIVSDLKKIAEKTGGLFIKIPDLPTSVLNSPEILRSLREELKNLNLRLNEQLPINEKEKILERLISLKNYINSIIQSNTKMEKDFRDSLDSVSEGIKNLIIRDDELLEIMKFARIKVKFGSAQADREVSMAELFKLLFVKLRSYFYRYRE